MYEHRKQRELRSMLSLGWRLLWMEEGSASIAFFYAVIHVAGVFDRHGWRRLADRMRRFVSVARVERAISRLMKARIRLVIPEVGGCAIDIDTDEEYDAIVQAYPQLWPLQRERAEALAGPLPLPEEASGAKADPARGGGSS